MSSVNAAVPERIFGSLPSTQRGMATFINASAKAGKMAYGCLNTVVLRSLDDPSECSVFIGHKAKVKVAKFSPNGEWVASGDESGMVIIWSAKSKIVKQERVACRSVLDLDWSEDGLRVAAVGEGDVCGSCFDWASGNNFGSIAVGHSKATSVAFKPTRPFRVVSTGEELSTVVCSGPPFKFEKSSKIFERFPNCVRFSPDGNYFIVVSSCKKVALYDGKNGELIRNLGESKENHTGSIYCATWSGDSKQILTCSADKTAKLWNVEDGSVVKTFTFGKDVESMQVGCTWAGNHVITLSLSGSINFLDMDNPSQPKLVIESHQDTLTALAVNQGVVASADNRGRVVVWDMNSGLGKFLTGAGHGKPVRDLSISCDGHKILSVGMDDCLFISEVKSNAFGSSTSIGFLPAKVAAARHDPNLAVVGGEKHLAVVQGGNVVSKVDIPSQCFSLAFAVDGSEVAVGTESGKILRYNVSGGALTAAETIQLPNKAKVASIQYSLDGSKILSGDGERDIFIMDLKTKKPVNPSWKYHNGGVLQARWAPDESRILTSANDQTIRVWLDLESYVARKHVVLDKVHRTAASFVEWIDSTYALSVGDDVTLKLWKIPTSL